MPEFDFPAAIKELAEAEIPCPTLIWHESKAAVERSENCPGGCAGTGRIVPFAALRVACRLSYHKTGKYYDRVTSIVHRESCPGWIPELDVWVACWEVWKALPNRLKQTISVSPFEPISYNSWEEAVLRAALAWLKEQANG